MNPPPVSGSSFLSVDDLERAIRLLIAAGFAQPDAEDIVHGLVVEVLSGWADAVPEHQRGIFWTRFPQRRNDAWRRLRTRRSHEVEQEPPASELSDPAVSVIERDRAQRALDAFSPEVQAIFMALAQGYSYHEIAQRNGRTALALRLLICRARKRA